MCARMYDDVRADVQVSWARMYSRFAWVYTDVRADVHPNRTILYFLLSFARMYNDVCADVRRCARGCTEELGADVQRVRVDVRRCARSNLYIRIALLCTFCSIYSVLSGDALA